MTSIEFPEGLSIVSSHFESELGEQLEKVSQRVTSKAGDIMLNIGQSIRAIPLVLSC
jgi:hypothetical protein